MKRLSGKVVRSCWHAAGQRIKGRASGCIDVTHYPSVPFNRSRWPMPGNCAQYAPSVAGNAKWGTRDNKMRDSSDAQEPVRVLAFQGASGECLLK